ncbi:hypothetical protein NMG60_11003980 [Bertholletia excelsa]
MKSFSRSVAALAVAIILILLSWSTQAQASRLLLMKAHSSSGASQSHKELRVDSKNPYKRLGSSFRTIPPSRSNPTQNK